MLVQAASIRSLSSPEDFYDSIIAGIRSAKRNITLSALYFGSGDHVIRMMQELRSAIDRNKDLRVTLVADFCRSTRSVDGSIDLFRDILRDHDARIIIGLYRMPILDGLLRYLPTPANEMLGVYHCKYCVFDDNAILTGANLSRDYFVDRQDRYIAVENDSMIPDALNEFTDIIIKHSHIVTSSGILMGPHDTRRFVLRKSLHALEQKSSAVPDNIPEGMVHFQLLLQNHAIGIESEREYLLRAVTSRLVGRDMTISSPYGNYTREFVDRLRGRVHLGNPIKFYFPSENSHGFKGAKGFKALVPELHKISICELMKSLTEDSDVKIFLFDRPNWTFHSKGVWFLPRESIERNCAFVYIGSSNGSVRSWQRDFELGFMMTTNNNALVNLFKAEVEAIQMYSRPVGAQDTLLKTIRWYGLKKTILHRMLKSFL
jgi:CDP-diacylglycerol--glycerol-3-phosphate 3-phosphatidyltransferase